MTTDTVAHRFDLLRELVARDLRLRYRRSVLGTVWSQLAPLSLLAVLTFVFTRVVDLGVEHYAAFAFTGILAWTWFQTSMVGATSSVVAARDLVRRPGFPVAMLPVASVATQLAQFALSLPVLLVTVVVSTGHLHATAAVLPGIVAVQFLLIIGPAYALAAANVRFRDVAHLVGVVLVPFFYATPVFYPGTRVPERYAWIYDLNPMVHVIGAYRRVLVDGTGPGTSLAVVAALAAAGAVAGAVVFHRRAATFAEQL